MKSLLVVALLAAGTPPAPVPLAIPTGKWVVDFATNHCIASRPYAPGGMDIILAIQTIPTQDGARLLIQAPRKLSSWGRENARIYIGGQRLEQSWALAEPVVKPGYARYVVGLKKEDYERLLRTGTLTFDGTHVRAHFQVQGLGALQKVLVQCNQGLLASWGLPRESQASLASFPKPDSAAAIFEGERLPQQGGQPGSDRRSPSAR